MKHLNFWVRNIFKIQAHKVTYCAASWWGDDYQENSTLTQQAPVKLYGKILGWQ